MKTPSHYYCSRCGARLAADHRGALCSPCARRQGRADQPIEHPLSFWQRDSLGEAIATQHFGKVITAYRLAHDLPLSQSTIGRWLEMTQAQVSRVERAVHPPSDLRKLQRWAEILRIPPEVLWFSAELRTHSPEVSAVASPSEDNSHDTRRRAMLELAGTTVGAGRDFVANAPWKRLADSLAGRRPADESSVGWVEARSREFFRTEETQPARILITSLRAHVDSTVRAVEVTTDDSHRRRLITAAGESQALIGWALFDLDRPDDAIRLYRQALDSAKEAGDGPLFACVLGFWSYLLSSRGEHRESARMLADASGHVRGSAATTQSWISARQAEEYALCGEPGQALHSLDRAITVFDYARPTDERGWTCFFTANRLGGLAVATYSRLNHPDTDRMSESLLSSTGPTDNKVKSLVLADLATSAARRGNYDQIEALSEQCVDLAFRTECSLAIDKLRSLVEILPKGSGGTAERIRRDLTARMRAATRT